METRTPTSGTAGHGNQLPVSTMVRGFGMLIESARHQVAVAANVALTTVYWESVIASGPRSCGVCGQSMARGLLPVWGGNCAMGAASAKKMCAG